MKKASIIEVTRRAMSNEDEGMACGPIGIMAADAEIVVNDEGKTIYLHGQWISECYDEYLLEATLESVYDVYEKMNNFSDDEFSSLLEERDRICDSAKEDVFLSSIDVEERYAEQFAQIKEMLLEKAEEMGYEFFDDEDMEEEEDE